MWEGVGGGGAGGCGLYWTLCTGAEETPLERGEMGEGRREKEREREREREREKGKENGRGREKGEREGERNRCV